MGREPHPMDAAATLQARAEETIARCALARVRAAQLQQRTHVMRRMARMVRAQVHEPPEPPRTTMV